MRKKELLLIVLMLVLSAELGHSLLNIDFGAGYGLEPVAAQGETKDALPYYSGGIGIDLVRIQDSAMLQLRFGISHGDYTASATEVTLTTLFIGPRIVFAGNRFPDWLALYLDFGIGLVSNQGAIADGSKSSFNTVFGVGLGLEFYVWEGLYLGVGMSYFSTFNIVNVYPFIGYRIR